MDSLRKIFHDGDTDGSGELDLDELHALVRKHQARCEKWGGIHLVKLARDLKHEFSPQNVAFGRGFSLISGKSR